MSSIIAVMFVSKVCISLNVTVEPKQKMTSRQSVSNFAAFPKEILLNAFEQALMSSAALKERKSAHLITAIQNAMVLISITII